MAQLVTHYDDGGALTVVGENFEQLTKAIFIIVIRKVSAHHSLEDPSDSCRVLWCKS